MNEVMASACCTRASSCSGANQRATGTSTAKMRPRSWRHAIPSSTVGVGLSMTACIPVLISLRKDLAPFLFHGLAHGRGGIRDRRELVDPFVGPAGVDRRPRAMALLVALADHGIQRTTPAPAHNLDVLLGIGASRERPQHVVGIGGIDIVVHHNCVASQISAGVTIGGYHAGLSCVAGVALLDGNYVEQPA